MSRTTKRRIMGSRVKGFTLIELLVVIAIIAILAAILFPVFARARENARRASCQNNLKQIGIGLMQYTQDYDERYPYTTDVSGTPSWRVATEPYIKSTQVFKCPSNRDTVLASDGYPRTYAVNGYQSSYPWGGTDRPPFCFGPKLPSIQYPAQLIAVVDASNFAYSTAYPNDTLATEGRPWTFFAGHLGTMNCLFFDGHVKSLRPATTGRPYNMWIADKQDQPASNETMDELNGIQNVYR